MSPGILALFSARGVDRVWRDPRSHARCFSLHRCRPNCGRQSGWCCDWVRLMERPV